MIGMEGAVGLTVARLADRVPAKVAELVDRYGIGVADLPAPKLYAPSERSRLEPKETPAVLVVGQDETYAGDGPTPVDAAGAELWPGAIIHRFTYRIRVFVFARGTTFDETSTRRHRLALAVREVVLADLWLEDPAGEDLPSAQVNPASLRGSYSDVGDEGSRRSIAAAWVEFTATVPEVLAAPPLAVANTIIVTADPLGHPAYD